MKRTFLGSGSLSRGCRGGSYIEAAIAVPCFIIGVLALVDITRYFLIRGVMTTAGNRAVSVAAIVPNLDSDDTSVRGSVENQITQLAKSVAMRSGLSESPNALAQLTEARVIVGASSGDIRQTLMEQPIEVRLSAQFKFVTPLIPASTITVRALAYREMTIQTQFPAMLCDGRTFSNSCADGEELDPVSCSCRPCNTEDTVAYGGVTYAFEYYDAAAKKCLCGRTGDKTSTNVGPGGTIIPVLYDFNQGRQWMQKACLGRTKTYNQQTCRCEDCPEGQAPQEYPGIYLGGNYQWGDCVQCPSSAYPNFQVDPDTGQCACMLPDPADPTRKLRLEFGETDNLSTPINEADPTHPLRESCAESGMYFSYATCNCTGCGTNKVLTQHALSCCCRVFTPEIGELAPLSGCGAYEARNKEFCAASGLVFNASACACNPASCPEGQELYDAGVSGYACRCTNFCPGGSRASTSYSCVCQISGG